MTLSPDDLAAMKALAERVVEHPGAASSRSLATKLLRLLDEVEALRGAVENVVGWSQHLGDHDETPAWLKNTFNAWAGRIEIPLHTNLTRVLPEEVMTQTANEPST